MYKEQALKMAIEWVGHDACYLYVGKPSEKQPPIEEVARLIVAVASIFESYLKGE